MTLRPWTYPQQRDLMVLWHRGELSLQDIGDRLGRTAAAVQTRGKELRLPDRKAIRAAWRRAQSEKAA